MPGKKRQPPPPVKRGPKPQSLIGRTFGRLTVTGRAESNASRQAQWKVQCECGRKKVVRGTHLSTGRVVSCGCKKSEPRSTPPPVKIDGTVKKKNPLYGIRAKTREELSRKMAEAKAKADQLAALNKARAKLKLPPLSRLPKRKWAEPEPRTKA